MGVWRKRRQMEISPSGADVTFGLSSNALYVPRKSSRNGAIIFSLAVFIVACVVVLAASAAFAGTVNAGTIVVMLAVALAVVSSVHIALSWERVVILRLGKVNRVVGPGLYFTIPIFEHGTIRVDQRIIATPLARRRRFRQTLFLSTSTRCSTGSCAMLKRRARRSKITIPR